MDLDIFLGPDFVITVEEDPCPRTRELLGKIRSNGNGQSADQTFYQIVDVLVDSYPPVIDHYVEIIDQLEEDVLDNPDPKMLQKILVTKRALLELRRIMSQTREATGHLLRSQSPFIGKALAPFFRDVYDHVARNLDLLETERDLLAGTLDIYLSSVANRTNQVMKVLAVMSTIALPSIVISGFFGMNLKQMPFSENPNGPYIVIAMMAAVTRQYMRNSPVRARAGRQRQPWRQCIASTAKLQPERNMNTISTISPPRLSNAAIDERVEKPPVATVEKVWHTASNIP